MGLKHKKAAKPKAPEPVEDVDEDEELPEETVAQLSSRMKAEDKAAKAVEDEEVAASEDEDDDEEEAPAKHVRCV